MLRFVGLISQLLPSRKRTYPLGPMTEDEQELLRESRAATLGLQSSASWQDIREREFELAGRSSSMTQ